MTVELDEVAERGWGSSPARARPSLQAGFAARLAALFLPLLAGSLVASAQGFLVPMPLGELIGAAQAIVAGRISAVGDATFTLEIEVALAGELEGGLIEIDKFAALAQDPRWADYAAGQQVMVFLTREPSQPRCAAPSRAGWKILGRLGEGEIALEGAYAYFHRRYVTPLPPDYHTFHGQTSYLQRIERDTLVDAVRDYRACFDWPEEAKEQRRPLLTCSLGALCAYRERSALHGFLVQETDEILERRPAASPTVTRPLDLSDPETDTRD